MLNDLRAGERLPPEHFAQVKLRAVREAFKWNITDSGEEKLCDFPLLLSRSTVNTLSEVAEKLAREAATAQAELGVRTELQSRLGIPAWLRRAIRIAGDTESVRYCRFDFHP